MKGLSEKELLIYIVVVILSALVFHSDLFSDPAARLEMMSDRANYYRPLIFGLGIYVLIGLVRLIVIGIRKIIKR